MASYIVRKGRLEKEPGIERGQMLVRPEEEWRRRRLDLIKRSRMKAIIHIAIIYVPVPIFFVMILVELFENLGLVLIMVLGLWTILIIGTPYIVYREMLKDNVEEPAEGLYENGVQMLGTFIPYTEIASTERKVGRKGVTSVILHPRYERRKENGKVIKRPWSLSKSILGEEGVEELEKRVRAQGSPERSRDDSDIGA